MFCVQCGNRIQESERFCTKCGAKTPEPAPAACGAVVQPIAAPEMARSNAVAVTDALNSAVLAPPPSPMQPEPPAQPFRLFGVEMGEHPGQPAPIAASSGDVLPVTQVSSGLGAAFWFAGFLVVVLGTVGFFAWTMLSSRSSGVSVRVDPASVQMQAGGTTTLSATVAGDPDANVTWNVMEGAGAGFVRSTGVTATGGTVAASAEYLAPLKAGTYHVLATSNKDKRQASSAEIVVAP